MRLVLVLAVVLASGCRDEELARLRSIRDEVCACKTPRCGEDALKRIPVHDGSDEQRKLASSHRAQEVARAMTDCLAKLYLADRPTTDPDAEQPAPDEPEPAAPAPPAAAKKP